MKQIKSSIKNVATLRRFTQLAPVTENKTRWSGKVHMFDRFGRIRNELVAVHNDREAPLQMPQATRTSGFLNGVVKKKEQFDYINAVTVDLQKRGTTLEYAQLLLDNLSEQIHRGRNNVESKVYGCRLGKVYISSTSAKLKSPVFESGVIKIQRREFDNLTDEEKAATTMLRNENVGGGGNLNDEEEEPLDEAALSVREIVEHRRKRQKLQHVEKYINADFILGSGAEVERLFSLAKNFMPDNRKGRTSPILLEALLFLLCNRDLWDVHTVARAYKKVRERRSNNALTRHEEEDRLHEELN